MTLNKAPRSFDTTLGILCHFKIKMLTSTEYTYLFSMRDLVLITFNVRMNERQGKKYFQLYTVWMFAFRSAMQGETFSAVVSPLCRLLKLSAIT